MDIRQLIWFMFSDLMEDSRPLSVISSYNSVFCYVLWWRSQLCGKILCMHFCFVAKNKKVKKM